MPRHFHCFAAIIAAMPLILPLPPIFADIFLSPLFTPLRHFAIFDIATPDFLSPAFIAARFRYAPRPILITPPPAYYFSYAFAIFDFLFAMMPIFACHF